MPESNVLLKMDPLVHSQMKALAKRMGVDRHQIYKKAAIDFLLESKKKHEAAIEAEKDAIFKYNAMG